MANHLALPAADVRPARSLSEGAAVLVALAVFVALHALAGFPTLLTRGGDNDSLLRLVEVRDLMAGQGWFDLHQFRMGPAGGLVMHWSRIVDAPIALLIAVGGALGGSGAAGEIFAQFAWPLGLFAGSLLLLLRLARRLGGEAAVLPALVIGAGALHFVGIFAPGVLDHHNVQLFLLLLLAWLLLREPACPAAAGACAAVMLGIGVETVPHLAAAGLFLALRFVAGGEGAASEARRFGLGLAAMSALVFAGTVAPDRWNSAPCFAYSLPQGLLAVLAGLGLAGVASVPQFGRSWQTRLLGLLGLGAACAALIPAFFPQCLASPYGNLDPRLKALWLDGIDEAQPFHRLLRASPARAAGHYGAPLLALLLALHGLLKGGRNRDGVLLATLLGVAVAVSLWQVRGAFFAVPLAAPFLAAWVAARRHGPSPATVLAWAASFPFVWTAAVGLAAPAATAPENGMGQAERECETAGALGALAALPPARVLAVSNLGSAILLHTPHSVLAGPYAQNVAGNLAALDIWMAPPEQAKGLLQASGAEVLAFCPGNPESRELAGAAPGGLVAVLGQTTAPAWLSAVRGTENAPLRLFRISPP